ncbi:dipeptidase [Membranihabitans marinus]|uniref:dipeptidase n=1 Tax=Membranihabitans marinus TaxID=1227546 RepID=UPI001F172FAC|nr:dipeptidase [Membranihabitans marinus]
MYRLIYKILLATLTMSVFTACHSSQHLTKKAQRIANKTLITDGHIDLPYRLRVKNFQLNRQYLGIPIESADGDFDYVRAKKGGLDAPFMSIFIPSSYQDTDGGKVLADSLIDMINGIIDAHPQNFARGLSPMAIEENTAKGLISLPLGMENGAPIGEDLDLINYFFDRGIRYITLSHGKYNQICDSSYDPERKWNGLSPFGYEVVKRMNDVGMMIDVSHISDSSFYQVLRTTRTPVIASHSSCRIYTPGFERNMSDDMIRAMKDNGGVIQINFGSTFIDSDVSKSREQYGSDWNQYLKDHNIEANSSEAKDRELDFKNNYPYPLFATVEKVADHIDHVVAIAGIDHVGLGSDYDGVGDSLPTGLKDVADYPNLLAELLHRGYSKKDLEKICYKNVWRVWNSVLLAAQ